MGIRDMKYVPKLTLPDSPSISGLFNASKKKKKKVPEMINNVPAISKAFLKNFIIISSFSVFLFAWVWGCL
jgi:hypothetical protein